MLTESAKARLVSTVTRAILECGIEAAAEYGPTRSVDHLIGSVSDSPDKQSLAENREEAIKIVAGIMGLT